MNVFITIVLIWTLSDIFSLPVGFNGSYTNSEDRIDVAFFRKAAALGNEDAQKSLDELENNQQ